MSIMTYEVTEKQAALVSELNAQVTRAQEQRDVALTAIAAGHDADGTITAFNVDHRTITIETHDD